MTLLDRWFEKDIEIRYAETDQMGVVHHAVYPIWCELLRVQMCRDMGLPYHEVEAAGYYFMVAGMSFRFLKPARYGEDVYVRGRISRLHRRLLDYEYEIRRRADDQVLVTGTSKHVVTRGSSGPAAMPEEMLARLSGEPE